VQSPPLLLHVDQYFCICSSSPMHADHWLLRLPAFHFAVVVLWPVINFLFVDLQGSGFVKVEGVIGRRR
jgi:hypothetical protein